MGFRYRRRIAIAPGLTLNASKGGISLSVGGPGHSLNIGSGGVSATVGIPGTGASYTQKIYRWKQKAARAAVLPEPPIAVPADPERDPAFLNMVALVDPLITDLRSDGAYDAYVNQIQASVEDEGFFTPGMDEVGVQVEQRLASRLAQLTDDTAASVVGFICWFAAHDAYELLQKQGLPVRLAQPGEEEVVTSPDPNHNSEVETREAHAVAGEFQAGQRPAVEPTPWWLLLALLAAAGAVFFVLLNSR